MATGRVLVQRGVYEPFLAKLTAKAESLTVGDLATEEVTLGPLINEAQRDHAAKLLAQAQDVGARVETGGSYDKLFFEATVLAQGIEALGPRGAMGVVGAPPLGTAAQFDVNNLFGGSNDSRHR